MGRTEAAGRGEEMAGAVAGVADSLLRGGVLHPAGYGRRFELGDVPRLPAFRTTNQSAKFLAIHDQQRRQPGIVQHGGDFVHPGLH